MPSSLNLLPRQSVPALALFFPPDIKRSGPNARGLGLPGRTKKNWERGEIFPVQPMGATITGFEENHPRYQSTGAKKRFPSLRGTFLNS